MARPRRHVRELREWPGTPFQSPFPAEHWARAQRLLFWIEVMRALLVVGLLALLGWLLSACTVPVDYAPPDIDAEQEAVTDAALEAWEDWFGRDIPQCWLERERLQRVVFEAADFVRNCNARRSWEATGCFGYLNDGVTPRVKLRAGVVQTDEQRLELYAHELMHWLLICSGRRPHGDGDAEHSDATVWDSQIIRTLEAM